MMIHKPHNNMFISSFAVRVDGVNDVRIPLFNSSPKVVLEHTQGIKELLVVELGEQVFHGAVMTLMHLGDLC